MSLNEFYTHKRTVPGYEVCYVYELKRGWMFNETPIMKCSYGTDQCKISHGLVLGKR